MSRATVPRDAADLQRDWMPMLREFIGRFAWGSFTWNPDNVAANSALDTTFTTTDTSSVRGLRTVHAVAITPPSTLDAGLVVAGWVPADDQLTIRIGNVTGSGINPASGTWLFSAVLTA